MYAVQDRLAIQLLFESKEFPFNRMNALGYLHIAASAKLSVPMLDMQVMDTIGWISKNSVLFDGARIEIVLSSKGGVGRTYSFRLNSFREDRAGDTTTYHIDGYLDAPRYWSGSQRDSVTGTPSEVLRRIASECGLKEDIDGTTNSQTWYARNQKYHEWAREIGDSGYASDQSCMILALDLDGTLRYKNVGISASTNKVISLIQQVREAIHAPVFLPRVTSGVANMVSGYQSNLVQQNPLSSQLYRVHQRVEFQNDEQGSLMVNGNVSSSVNRGRVMFAPINPGNVGEEYERGRYQNNRVGFLYSVGLDVLTPDVTDLPLLSVVDVTSPVDERTKVYAGRYRVVTRTLFVKGADYYEKLELSRKTLNTNVDTAIVANEGSLYEDFEG